MEGTANGRNEEMRQVVAERRLALLHELAVRTAGARTWQDACARSAEALRSNPDDLPFALIYLPTPGGGEGLSLAAVCGIEDGHPAARAPWPFAAVPCGPGIHVVDDLRAMVGAPLPADAGPEPPGRAALIPLTAPGRTGRSGVLVVGLDPSQAFDDGYLGFLTLVAGQISAGVAGAQAYAGEEQRAALNRALHRSEERYRAIVEGQAEMVCRFRPDGTILFVNGAYARARGTTPEVLASANFWDFIEEEDRPAVRLLLGQLRPEAPEIRIENRFETAEGVRWTLWTNHGLAFDADGRATEVQSSGIDITERKRAEQALRQLNETLEERVKERTRQVQELASRLTMAEQEERRRISQILHDDLQQILFAVEMKMSLIRRGLEQADQPELVENLDSARAWIRQAVATTRQLTVDLSPPILQHEGLADALRWLQQQMRELHGLDVAIEADHRFHIPDEDLRVLLFQSVRELLFNVKKHAGVDRAVVRLAEDAGALLIQVVDAGRGFDVAEVVSRDAQAGGFGLFSVRERLVLLGGRLHVRSRPGEGTHVEMHLPLGSVE